MKYLKYFENSAAIGGGVEVDLPNVSYLEGGNIILAGNGLGTSASLTYEDTVSAMCLNVNILNNGDNYNTIVAANGNLCNVSLNSRTLYKDNAWNTVSFPFDINKDTDPFLSGGIVRELDTVRSGYDASTNALWVYLKELDGSLLKSNTPYLIKWPDGDNVVSPTFKGVILKKSEKISTSSIDGEIEFVGTISSVTLYGSQYAYLGNNSKLLYVDSPSGKKIYTCRAYFHAPNLDFKDNEVHFRID